LAAVTSLTILHKNQHGDIAVKSNKEIAPTTCTVTKTHTSNAGTPYQIIKMAKVTVTISVRKVEKNFNSSPKLDIPLKEFIDYEPQDHMVMYKGSMTEPSCEENVTWLINLHTHVIMPEQVKALKSLLSLRSIPDLNDSDGGNNRNI